ncbi:hypothetical protein, partial [Ancylobacter lacus]|uniref:hypothetical protein n=1 Tax=Ancylobacter lacus TaxID=2579970 RepID=UPI001BD18FDC
RLSAGFFGTSDVAGAVFMRGRMTSPNGPVNACLGRTASALRIKHAQMGYVFDLSEDISSAIEGVQQGGSGAFSAQLRGFGR